MNREATAFSICLLKRMPRCVILTLNCDRKSRVKAEEFEEGAVSDGENDGISWKLYGN